MELLERARLLGLAYDDFLFSLPLRRRSLLEDHCDLLSGKRVLELGPHTGYMTEYLLAQDCDVTAVDDHALASDLLEKTFGKSLTLIRGDAHMILPRLQTQFDVILCTGILYHSPSPLHLLSAIRKLSPGLVLIDTLPGPASGVTLNTDYLERQAPGGHESSDVTAGMTLQLSDEVLELALSRLGFSMHRKIGKKDLFLPSDKHSPYFEKWKRGFSAWLECRR